MIATIASDTRRPSTTSIRPLLSQADVAWIEEGYRNGLPRHAGIERHLRGVVHDTLTHAGSLARAQLAFSLMSASGFDRLTARDVGLAIEYYHTASLLLDDLPCMDDASYRRGHPCPHIVHGEAAAILGSLAMITRAYNLLWNAIHSLPARRRRKVAQLVHDCLGLPGILNGQSHDLHFAESSQSMADVMRVAEGKTVSLIRLTLLLPAYMSGRRQKELADWEQLASAWGLAYQIMDDFKDHLLTTGETGKSTARDAALQHPNLPGVIGAEAAMEILDARLTASRESIARIARGFNGGAALERLQYMLESDRDRIARRMGLGQGLACPAT